MWCTTVSLCSIKNAVGTKKYMCRMRLKMCRFFFLHGFIWPCLIHGREHKHVRVWKILNDVKTVKGQCAVRPIFAPLFCIIGNWENTILLLRMINKLFSIFNSIYNHIIFQWLKIWFPKFVNFYQIWPKIIIISKCHFDGSLNQLRYPWVTLAETFEYNNLNNSIKNWYCSHS